MLTFGEAKSSETESADKSQYTLFNPTPDYLMREFTTDRPHTTDNPFTIDAGHVQIETNLLGYELSRPDLEGTITEAFDVLTTNFRIGLTNSAEIDIFPQPYGVISTRPPSPSASFRNSGVGSLLIRAKYNLWGNDTFGEPGATALGLLPILSLPVDKSNGVSPTYVEGALMVPFTVQLSEKLVLETFPGGLFLRDSGATTHHAEFLVTANFEYEWTETFGTFYEVVYQFAREDPRGDIVLLNTGFTYLLNRNLQLDAAINFGVTPASPRANPFIGITARF
ncbi:MAG: transporter [Candidatus Binatia bacterium]